MAFERPSDLPTAKTELQKVPTHSNALALPGIPILGFQTSVSDIVS